MYEQTLLKKGGAFSYTEFNIKTRSLFNTQRLLRKKGKDPKSLRDDVISLTVGWWRPRRTVQNQADMEPTLLDLFDDRQKAIDHALWLNFKYRIAKIRFGVIHGPERGWAVCEEATANEMGICFLDVMPKDHSKMSYRDIRHIRMDREPLPHWEAIAGMFSVADGEILRYLLHAKVPIEMFIRHELASRGYDKDHRWCGFDKAEEIWLEEK